MLLLLTLIHRHLPRWVWSIVLLGLFAVAAGFCLRNVIFPLDRIGSLENDPATMVWALWITGWNTVHHHSLFLTDLAYWPVGTNLAHHPLASGYILFTWPLAFAQHADVHEYIIAYNLLIWGSFVGLLASSYLAARELDSPAIPALGGAVAIAFSTFFRANAVNLNHISAFTVLFATWLLLRSWKRKSRGAFYALAATLGGSFYFTELIAFWAMAVALAIVVLLSTQAGRVALIDRLKSIGWMHILAGGALTLIVAAPFLSAFARSRLPGYDLNEHSRYSANLLGFIVPDKHMTPLYGSAFEWANRHVTLGVNGFRVFVGFPVLLAGIAGLCVMPRTAKCVTGVVLAAFVVLALGPRLKVGAVSWDYPLPYAWIMNLPPLVGSRTPARLVVVVITVLALCSAYFWRWLDARACGFRWQRATRFAAVVAWPIWVATEGYSVAGMKPAVTVPAQFATPTPGSVLQLPLEMINGYVGLTQIRHHQPTITGAVARMSPEMNVQWWTLNNALETGGPALDLMLKHWDVKTLVIPPHFTYDRRSELHLLRALERPGITLVDSRPAPWVMTGASSLEPDRDLGRTYLKLAVGETRDLSNPRNCHATELEIAGTAGSKLRLRFVRARAVVGDIAVAFSGSATSAVTVRLLPLDPPLVAAGFDQVQIANESSAECRIAYLHFRDAAP